MTTEEKEKEKEKEKEREREREGRDIFANCVILLSVDISLHTLNFIGVIIDWLKINNV